MAEPVTGSVPAKAYDICGARNRAGGPCARPAGWGTDHAGSGRCKLHGGASPIKHGRYSTVVRDSVAELHAKLEAEDPATKLDILPEATLIRALAGDFIDRYNVLVDALVAWNDEEYSRASESRTKPRPQRIPDLSEAVGLLDTASRVIDRIHKQRSDNAISRPDLMRLMAEMARVVEANVPDEESRQRIKEGWLALRVA